MRAHDGDPVVFGQRLESAACEAGAKQARIEAQSEQIGKRAVRLDWTSCVSGVQPPAVFRANGDPCVPQVVTGQGHHQDAFREADDALNPAHVEPVDVAFVPGFPVGLVCPVLRAIAP